MFNEKEYWENRTKAYLEQTKSIRKWRKQTIAEAELEVIETEIQVLEKLLKEKQDVRFCLKYEISTEQKN